MANLLPVHTKKKLIWQKRQRVVVIFTVITMLGIGVGGSILLPAAIYTYIVRAGLEEDAPELQGDSPGAQRQALTRALRRDQQLLEKVAYSRQLPAVHETLEEALTALSRIEGVAVRSFTMEAQREAGEYSIHISGVAATRTAVVAIRDGFEEGAQFIVEEFPISNLTPRYDTYEFIMTVRYTQHAES